MRIVFLCSIKDKAIGGLDVIFRHSEILKKNGFETYIYDIKQESLFRRLFFKMPERYHNFDLNIIHSFANFHNEDIVLIPEILVKKYAPICIKSGINFAILVQGPFLIEPNDYDFYYKAKIILSTSIFIENFLRNIFVIKKVPRIFTIRLSVSINSKNYKKQNLITFMPRKLNKHTYLYIEQVKKFIPPNWNLLSIHNMNHNEVIENLKKSQIFLHFNDLEGFGLPALEAAICKNFVIGYSGMGGDEFFKKPLFYKIEYGNLINFKKTLLKVIEDIDLNLLNINNYNKYHKNLITKYSYKNETKSLKMLTEILKKTIN